MGPTWGPPGSCWPQMGPMLARELCYQGNPSSYLLGFNYIQQDCKGTTLRLERNGRHFAADNIFKCIYFKEKVSILIEIPLKFVFNCPIDSKSELVQVMAWLSAKPLPEPMMTELADADMRHQSSRS